VRTERETLSLRTLQGRGTAVTGGLDFGSFDGAEPRNHPF
jgi:hypothetical protein